MMRKPQSILMTADSVGGVWTYALELTCALACHDIEVNLALMGPPLTPAQREAADKIPNLNLFKSDYKLEWMSESEPDVRRAGYWLLHLASRLCPDVVHLNGYAHACLPWNSPTLVVGHSCAFSWWRAVHREAPPAAWERYKSEVTNALRGAHMVVAPSRAMLSALKMNYGKIENGRVIANGRNPQFFRPRKKQPLVFSAGRLWDAAKNIESVAKVAPNLPWQVCIAGEVRAPQQAQPPPAWTRECQVLGPLPEADVREWFASAAIYALPALYEPFGYTPLEAALSGCALVLGDIESLREIWDGAAVFVDPHDREALQTELMRLIQNCNYRREMSRRARVWGLHYSTERMGQNYLAAYSDLLAYSQPVRQRQRFVQCA